MLYTCRTDNWNEKLGKVSASDVAVVVSNHCSTGGEAHLEPITLSDYLRRAGMYASYAGLADNTDLSDANLDQEVSIRFQTTFLPVDDSDLAAVEFCSEAYNYNTSSDDNPRNAVLLCTTQGVAFQQDGQGAKKIFHHAVGGNGIVHRYWLEAERSKHKVGGPQKETLEEQKVAAARGKAAASVIGIQAMGTRFNALMIIQVPLLQQPRRKQTVQNLSSPSVVLVGRYGLGQFGKKDRWYKCHVVRENKDGSIKVKWADGTVTSKFPKAKFEPLDKEKCEEEEYEEEEEESIAGCCLFGDDSDYSDEDFDDDDGTEDVSRRGKSSAARVSRGSEVEGPLWQGLDQSRMKRDPQQHITVTITMYNCVTGGVPSADDICAAINDMERLYDACQWNGRLVEDGAQFIKTPLTVDDCQNILSKLTDQPYQPKGVIVQNGHIFPTNAQ